MRRSLLNDIVIAIMIVFSFILLPYFNASRYATNLLIPLSFLYFFYQSSLHFVFNNTAIKRFSIFVLWTMFSSLFSINYDLALQTEKRLFLVLIFTVTVYLYVSISIHNILTAYRLLIIVLFLLIIHTFLVGQISPYGSGLQRFESVRLSDDNPLLLDPNSFGYFIFIGISSAFMIYIVYKNSIFNKLKIVLLVIISFITILYTASRGSYMVFVLVLTFNIIIVFTSNKLTNYRGFLLITLIIISVPIIYSNSEKIIQDTALGNRFLMAKQIESPRVLHIREAIKVGLNHPILGVGGGNYSIVTRSFEQGSFSHNSYAEAFANYGLPGLFLLLFLYAEFLIKLIYALIDKRIKDKKVVYYLISFFIAFLAYNIFYVTYLTIEFMCAYIIARTHLEHVLKNRIIIRPPKLYRFK